MHRSRPLFFPVFAVALFLNLIACAEKPELELKAPAPPFERILVMTGFGMDAPLLDGIIAGLDEKHRPDLIIGGCGASIPTGLAHVEPDSQKRLEYYLSESFYKERARAQVRAELNSADSLISNFTLIRARNLFAANPAIPDIFRKALVQIPNDLGVGGPLDRGFSAQEKIRVLLLCAKVNFTDTDFGKSKNAWKKGGKNLYSLAVYTDEEIASFLQQAPSWKTPLSDKADLDPAPVFYTQEKICTAARCSIADPYLIDPLQNEQGAFITGAIDHYPFELAKRLGKTVYFIQKTKFSDVEATSYLDIFGIDIHKRHNEAMKQKLDYWIDLSDIDDPQPNGFTPSKDGLGFDVDIARTSGEPPVKFRGPTEYGPDFRDRVQRLNDYGRERALEAIQQTPFDRSHIRFPNR